MSSNTGNILQINIFGESHNKAIGMTISNLPSGIKIDEDNISKALEQRISDKSISTARNENDKPIFLSGVFNGYTTGAPLTFIIYNNDVDSSSYHIGEVRPGHADLTNTLKYDAYNDYRGGGFSSGRIATSFIVLGEICKSALHKYDIKVATHIKNIANIIDDSFSYDEKEIDSLLNKDFPVINDKKGQLMKEKILEVKKESDSIGGEIETIILNAPIALGEPYFDSFESDISKMIFSLGGVKGIYFGDYQKIISSKGSEFNDQLELKDNEIHFLTNNNAGINGGITNGEPILFTTLIKPTPSIGKKQKSINLKDNKNIELEIKGRHDPSLCHRLVPLVNAISYYVILDLLMCKESKNI